MTEVPMETLPPVPAVETTTPNQPATDPEKEQMQKKIVELEAQKDHWRNKYDRDIVNPPQPNNPAPVPQDDVFSDEGKLLVEKYVAPLQQEINLLQEQIALRDLQTQYPILRETAPEFAEFRRSYPGVKLEAAVKLFMSEKGLSQPPKPGLERPTSGDRTPPKTGMTLAELDDMRVNDARAYEAYIKNNPIPKE